MNVDDRSYNFTIASSLFKYVHGRADMNTSEHGVVDRSFLSSFSRPRTNHRLAESSPSPD